MKQMSDAKEQRRSSAADIFQLLMETAEKENRKRRQELLAPLDLTEFFVDGSVSINQRTCRGVDCKLCIKACPTNALFWKGGGVGITAELCIYCGACVLSCIVDDCIKVERKRQGGEYEKFSRPNDFTALQNRINAKKRHERIEEIKDLLPKPEDYLKKRRSEAKEK